MIHFPPRLPLMGLFGQPREFMHRAITAAPRASPSSAKRTFSSGAGIIFILFNFSNVKAGLFPVIPARPVIPILASS